LNNFIRISVFVCLTTLLTYCKKKTDPKPEGQSYSSTFDVNQYYTFKDNNLVLNGRKAIATIYCSGCKSYIPVSSLSVSLNSIVLKADPYDDRIYSDTIPQNSIPSFTWQIKSEHPYYGGFTEIVADSFPRFQKYNLMPDSISKSNPVVIQLGASNANEVVVYIDNGKSGIPGSSHAMFGVYPGGLRLPADTTSITLNYDPSLVSPSSCSLVIVYTKIYSQKVDERYVNPNNTSKNYKGLYLSSIYQKKIKFVD